MLSNGEKHKLGKKISISVFCCLILAFLISAVGIASSQSTQNTEDVKSQIEDLKEKRKYYEKKIAEIDRRIRELQKKLTYGEFSIIFAERHESLVIEGEKTALSISPLSFPKGTDALIVMLNVQNIGKKYIFVKKKMGFWGIMPGYVVDEKGKLYGEEGDAIRIETSMLKAWVAKVKTKTKGWVKVCPSGMVTKNVIAPGENYEWMFVFAVPKNRTIRDFIFRCGVADTVTSVAVEQEVRLSLAGKLREIGKAEEQEEETKLPKEIYSADYSEFCAEYIKKKEELTSVQFEEWKQALVGKKIRWKGEVQDVKKSYTPEEGYEVLVDMSAEIDRLINRLVEKKVKEEEKKLKEEGVKGIIKDIMVTTLKEREKNRLSSSLAGTEKVIVYFSAKEKDKILSLKKGQKVEFIGTIENVWFMECALEVKGTRIYPIGET